MLEVERPQEPSANSAGRTTKADGRTRIRGLPPRPTFPTPSTRTSPPPQLMHSSGPVFWLRRPPLSGTLPCSQARDVSEALLPDSALLVILSRVNRWGKSGPCPADWCPGFTASSKSFLPGPQRPASGSFGAEGQDGSAEFLKLGAKASGGHCGKALSGVPVRDGLLRGAEDSSQKHSR